MNGLNDSGSQLQMHTSLYRRRIIYGEFLPTSLFSPQLNLYRWCINMYIHRHPLMTKQYI